MKLFLTALTLFAGVMPAAAQWLDRPWPDIPRTADGQPDLTAPAPRGPDGKPDFSGVWNGQRPDVNLELATLQPWVVDLARERQQNYYKTRPYYQCLPSGPETEHFGGWKRIIQSPSAIAILSDTLNYRVIHMDGRELEANPISSWAGYSVGRWEGDTLVVESNGFNDETWAVRFGVSHSESLQVTERYRRTDFGHIVGDVTFTDPEAFTEPWSFTVNMEVAADTEMLEAICEHTSEDWAGSMTEVADRGISVPAEVMAGYVGAYTGVYGGRERTYEVSISDGRLVATIVGDYTQSGLGAAGLDEGATRLLMPLSETLFEGLGLGYEFIVNDEGVATDLIVTHVSGNYTYARQR